MKRWSDVKSEIRSISEAEKAESEITARLIHDIISCREKAGLTQRELADRSGIKQSAIARLESGGAIPRLDTLLKLAKALGMKIALIHDEDACAAG